MGSIRRRALSRVRLLPVAILALWGATPATAGEVRAAVATNFAECLAELGAGFAAATGHRVVASSAATGILCAQIEAGAPFDVFFAADAERPARLVAAELADPASRFTYAAGRLVLWRPSGDGGLREAAAGDLARELADALADDDRAVLALASPRHAPYGRAAREALDALGWWERVADRAATGLNVGQTWQHVATGNAALGFVALSQVRGRQRHDAGWDPGRALVVPAELHAPIIQQAVLLRAAADTAAARALLAYVRGPAATDVLRRYGYEAPPPAAPGDAAP